MHSRSSNSYRRAFRQLGSLLNPVLRHRELTVIFGLALLLRLIQLILALNQIGDHGILEAVPDSKLYLKMAASVLDCSNEAERGFFRFGPGYAVFLAGFLALFGQIALPIVVTQIVLNALACLLIYRLAYLLTRSRSVATVAGLLSASSYTAISLSCTILSDTLFFLLFLTALVLFLEALESGRWRNFILAGLFVGVAILVRPIGQFWPLVFAALAAGYQWLQQSRNWPKRMLPERYWLKVLSTVFIGVAVVSIWIVRNELVHDIPTVSFASSGGPANVAGWTLERIEGRPAKEIRNEWADRYRNEHNKTRLTLADHFRLNLIETRKVLAEHPGEMAITYLDFTWKNVNEINQFHRHLIPQFNNKLVPMERRIRDSGLNKLCFVLSVVGLGLLLFKGQYWCALVLGSVYFYYASLIGFTRWQGSRLFLPGQIAWAILVAVVLIALWRAVNRRL